MERVSSLSNGRRHFGLPPPQFRSGQFPLSHSISHEEDESGLESDMETTESEDDETYAGKYTRDSQNASRYRYEQRPPNDTSSSGRNRNSSDNVFSDFSSSKETIRKKERFGNRSRMGNTKYSIRQREFTEDEFSDSAQSSEFTSYVESRAKRGIDYSSNAPLHRSNLSEKGIGRGLHGSMTFDDVPSAPPFCGSRQEMKCETSQATGREPSGICMDESTSFSPHTRPFSSHCQSSRFVASDESKFAPNVTSPAMDGEVAGYSSSFPARVPTFHASSQGPWLAVVAYESCVRLCLHSWARGCLEAPIFLESECALLRNAFGLQNILLQSEEELLERPSSQPFSEGIAAKPKKKTSKIKVQVRKVKMDPEMPTRCSFSSMKLPMVKMEMFRYRLYNFHANLSSGWETLRKVRVVPHAPTNSSFPKKSLAYMHASARYIKQVSGILKIGVTSLRNSSSYETVQESYSCQLRLKSASEENPVRLQPGSGETHVFFPDGMGDDLIVEVRDSKGISQGCASIQMANISDIRSEKLHWWPIYLEPDHALVGRLQLYINYITSSDENSSLKCGSVAETVAYDLVLEVAMKVQKFQQRNLWLHGPWKWLLDEYASYFGVSDAYTKLRYLSYVMDVATPIKDCLVLIHDLLYPVIQKSHHKSTLSHQENRMLGEIQEQVEQILALVFENYKSLDEESPTGIMDVFKPSTGTASPALFPAIKLYNLLHDVLSPDAQLKLCSYFQAATKRIAKRHLAETDEFVSNNGEGTVTDAVTLSTAYQKMKSLCMNIRNEVYMDIEINNEHILPSFINLQNISSSIYSVELCTRLRAFLIACPPPGPSPPVAELVIATADFQRDLDNWSISPVKGGVDAKELFHLYIMLWIKDKRVSLLECCKLDKVKLSVTRTQYSTTPFVDDMYDRLKATLNEYEVIIVRWPEYTFVLENAVADIEKAVLEALDKQYADVLAPLKDSAAPKKFGLKYMQKFTKLHSVYIVPEELGILLNTMKRLLDVLQPKIEAQLRSWGSCIPDGGSSVAGERLSEITVMLRAKLRTYLQATVEKFAENAHLQNATKLKRIIQDSKETASDSDIRSRMQPLKDQILNTIDHLHTVVGTHVFVAMCRGYWERMGQEVLSFLEKRRENRLWYRGSRVAVSVLDDIFASQMQKLLGNTLQEKDLEPPRSIMEVRSMLCKDAPTHKDSNYYY